MSAISKNTVKLIAMWAESEQTDASHRGSQCTRTCARTWAIIYIALRSQEVLEWSCPRSVNQTWKITGHMLHMTDVLLRDLSMQWPLKVHSRSLKCFVSKRATRGKNPLQKNPLYIYSQDHHQGTFLYLLILHAFIYIDVMKVLTNRVAVGTSVNEIVYDLKTSLMTCTI